MRFLNVNSPFMKYLNKLIDYMGVGILWIVFCVPVFTGGAATTAALLTVEISVRKEEGKILATFWKWFRREFKEATLLWMIQVPIHLLVMTNIWIVYVSNIPTLLQVLIYVATAFVFCWTQLWFGYLSKFEDSVKTVLQNTLRISLTNAGRVLLHGVIMVVYSAAAVLLFFLMPPLLVLLPGSYLLFYNSLINKVFARYLPQEESGPEEIPAET